MQKYQYLIRNIADQDFGEFKRQIFEDTVPQLLAGDPARLKVSLTDAPPPKLTVLPLQKNGLALLSVWSDSDPTPADWRSGRTAQGSQVAGYRVSESVPRAYDKTWQDGHASPGVVILTLMKQHPKLSREAFMHEWHERHTPKALRIHPLWNYIRNVLEAPIVPGSPAFDGIVEEHLRSRGEALNPIRFFGGAVRCLPHMLEVFRHANYFLDLKRCENYLLTETHVRS